MKTFLLSSLVILTGCAQLQPIKGVGRFLNVRDVYGEVVAQAETPTPNGCVAEARATQQNVGLFGSIDLECTDKSLEQQLPWSSSVTNTLTATTIIYRFRTSSLCRKVASASWDAREKLSADQKEMWTLGDCKADPSCDYCSARPAKK